MVSDINIPSYAFLTLTEHQVFPHLSDIFIKETLIYANTFKYTFLKAFDTNTLMSLVDGGCGIVGGGVKKISKANSQGGRNSRGIGKIWKI